MRRPFNWYPALRTIWPCADKLKIAAKKYPELPSAHVYMYQILSDLRVDQPKLACAHLAEALKEDPSDPEPYLILGSIALQDKRIAEAAMDLDKARQLLASYTNIKRKPAIEQQTISGLALLAESRQDWKEAEKLLRGLLRACARRSADLSAPGPSPVLARQGERGVRSFEEGEANRSRKCRQESWQRKVPHSGSHLGKVLLRVRGPAFPESGEMVPVRSEGSAGGLAYAPGRCPWALDVDKIAFAKEQAEEVLRIEAADKLLPPAEQKYPNSSVGSILRGEVALSERDWPMAEDIFRKLLLAKPKNFVARNNLALALIEQDDPAQMRRAVEYAESNFADNPKETDALITLGWIYCRWAVIDHPTFRLARSVKGKEGDVVNADTATRVAQALYDQGKKREAEVILEYLLKDDRQFSMRPECAPALR